MWPYTEEENEYISEQNSLNLIGIMILMDMVHKYI